jgi:hypothetical protein
MLARVDKLPQRHCWVTLRAAAPDVDFRTSVRCERIPGLHVPCLRNSPSRVCRAKPRGHWHIACGNCGNYKSLAAAAGLHRAARLAYRVRKLRKAPPWPARPGPHQNRGQAERLERSETHFSPISVRTYSWGRQREQKGQDHLRLDCSSAVSRVNGDWRT